MKNQEQGGPTHMVGQNAPIFLDPDTVKTTLTPRQAQRATRFLAMLNREAASGDAAGAVPAASPDVAERPVCKSYAEVAIERAERKVRSKAHHRPARKAAPPTAETTEGEDSPTGPAVWLLDALRVYEEQEAQAKAQRANVFVKERVQRQPLPRLEELLNLEAFRPKRGRGAGTAGAGALAVRLYELARIFLAARLYLYGKDGQPPRQVVMHLCAELLARSLGICDNTLREWTAQLQAAGSLFARAHYTTATLDGQRVTAIDGMLYAVRLAPDHTARLNYRDYKRQYRDLDADRATGRTAHNAIRNAEQRFEEARIAACVVDDENFIEGSPDPTGQMQAELLEQLRRWAVIPGNITTQNPLKPDPALIGADETERLLNGVQDVVFLLPILLEAHKSKRAALVGSMGAALARDLKDQHSRLYYCKVIWQAWQAEIEGRDGLQALAAQLQRLEVDRREWKGLRRPAALLASRLRAA